VGAPVTTGWLKVAATTNPTTCVLDAMRSLLNTGVMSG
jgi:hypothetical protein